MFQYLAGSITLTSQLENIFESLLSNRIPEKWLKNSYPSGKSFTSYFIDFCERVKWHQSWCQSNETPKSYWLSAFFHQRTFLASIKLDFARNHDVKLEEITLDFTVVNDNK